MDPSTLFVLRRAIMRCRLDKLVRGLGRVAEVVAAMITASHVMFR